MAKGAVEERGEEVLGLTQCLLVHRTQMVQPLTHGRKPLLQAQWRHRNAKGHNLADVHMGRG